MLTWPVPLSSPPVMPSRNEEYYLDDIVFQVSHHLPSVSNHYTGNNKVEDELFKVHRHLFVNLSPVFRDMYTIPVAKEDGISDDRPLVLEGIEKKDFTQLLRCLYPLQVILICSQSFSLLHFIKAIWRPQLGILSRGMAISVETSFAV